MAMATVNALDGFMIAGLFCLGAIVFVIVWFIWKCLKEKAKTTAIGFVTIAMAGILALLGGATYNSLPLAFGGVFLLMLCFTIGAVCFLSDGENSSNYDDYNSSFLKDTGEYVKKWKRENEVRTSSDIIGEEKKQ
jgi:predicted membrane channel-forming protein YqfA (hemolysin III family)